MNSQHFWYNLIELSRKKDLIIDGLTIPFILGAQNHIYSEMKLNDNSILELLTAIADSAENEKAVLKDCAGNQYIITLRTREFCKENLSNALRFKNKAGHDSFFVAKDVTDLGNSLAAISKSLNEKYKGLLNKETFSWNDRKMRWDKLSDAEREIIQEAART